MKFLVLLCCCLGFVEVYAQKSLATPLVYAYRSFLYYGEQNTFIIPHHPDTVVDDTGTVIEAPPIKDSLPPVHLISSHAELFLFEKHNVFIITPHALEPVHFICHRDTLTFPVVYLTYDRATLKIEPPQSVVTPMKKHYTLADGSTVLEQFNAFQEIFFETKDFKKAIDKKHTISFNLSILAYKNAMLGKRYSHNLYVDSIEVYVRNKQQQIVKKDKFKVGNSRFKELKEIIDKKFVKKGYTVEIVCSNVFLDERKREYKLSQYFINDNSHDEINDYLSVNKNYWEDFPWGSDLQLIALNKDRKHYGIPAIFRIRFY